MKDLPLPKDPERKSPISYPFPGRGMGSVLFAGTVSAEVIRAISDIDIARDSFLIGDEPLACFSFPCYTENRSTFAAQLSQLKSPLISYLVLVRAKVRIYLCVEASSKQMRQPK